MPPSAPNTGVNGGRQGRLLWVIGIIISALLIYLTTIDVLNYQKTGLVKVKSTNSNAILSVTQNNKEARLIGTGSARVRLNPGSYLISSAFHGRQSSAVIKVIKGQTTNMLLNPDSQPLLPSVQSVNFAGIDSLLNSGLTTTQIGLLKREFFNYNTGVKSVNISPSSIKPAPRNPDKDIAFKINFSATIDSTPSKETISYTGLNDLRLQIFDSITDQQIYDSGRINASGP